MIISFGNTSCFLLISAIYTNTLLGFPSLVLLVTKGKLLPENDRWDFGIWNIPIYLVSIGYSILVVIVSFVSHDSFYNLIEWGQSYTENETNKMFHFFIDSPVLSCDSGEYELHCDRHERVCYRHEFGMGL